MVESRSSFDNRLRSLGRKHNAMTHGVVTQMRGDGLIVLKPKRYRARRGFPVRGLVLFLLGFFAFKGFMLNDMGTQGYDERIASLATGTVVEQVGARVMQADPVTLLFADTWGKMLARL